MNEKLSIKAAAFASGVLWSSAVLVVGVLNRLSPPYGRGFLDIVSSVYPGYHAGTGGISVIIGALYALLDGAIAGLIFGWLYNSCAGCCHSKKT